MKIHTIVRLALILILLLSMGLVMACGGGSKVTISTLTLVPEKLAPDQTIIIGANVLNSGTKAEEYSATLKINDAVIETRQVTVAGGETKIISFEYIPKTIGSFSVDINGQKGSFNVLKPAAFVAESLIVSPDRAEPGDEITASIDVRNMGDLSGSYTATLKVDDKDIESKTITLDAGGSQTVKFTFSSDLSGSHVIDINGMSKAIMVLKPAEFQGTAVKINPASALPGQTVSIEAIIINNGDTRDTRSIVMEIDGMETDSQSLTLEGGASGTVTYTYTADAIGTFKINVMGATGSLTVSDLSKYTNKGQYFNYYTLSYPPDFTINEDGQNVSIEKADVGSVSVQFERVSTTVTPRLYFNILGHSRTNVYPDWNLTSEADVKDGDEVIGYEFDYSATVDGKKLFGRGMVIKRAGLGYVVEFSTHEALWESYQGVAERCVDSFESLKSYSGSYSNTRLGVALTLPAEWSVTETGNTNLPLYLYSPCNQNDIEGLVIVEVVSTGVSAKQYVDDSLKLAVTQGWSQGTGKTFTFNNGATGYETSISATISGGFLFEYKFYSYVGDGRAIVIRFGAASSAVDAQETAIVELAQSLVVSKPGGVPGVDRNQALFMVGGDIPTLDPAMVETGPGDIVGAIFSGLVRFDKDLNIVPELAESWDISNDGKTYTFYLRKNARFHDGRQVTAEDFKYSWERACDPVLDSPKAKSFLMDIVGARERLAGTASSISGIKVVDDYTLEVTLDAAKAYFLGEIAQPVAFVVDKNNVAEGTSWYEQPNGSGPFKIQTWEKDTLLVLERNDDFYLEPAKLKHLVFKLFAGYSMQLYENGEIDIAGIATSNLDRVLDTTNPLNKELLTGYSYDVSYLGFNVNMPPFDDPKIRQALAMAIDVDKLIDVTRKGRSERASGFVPPGIPGNNPDLQPIPYDVERAKQLITESKYGSADKVPPITMYMYYAVDPVEQAIIGMWQSLGLQVNTQAISSLEEYYARSHDREFQTYISGWRADYVDAQNFLEIFFQSQSPQNGFDYNNAEVDAALAEAGIEQDEATRIKMYQDIEKMVLEDLPAVPLWWKSKTYMLVKPYVKGYALLPIDVNIWRDISVEPH